MPGDAVPGPLYHAIGPKRQMPGVWGQSHQEPASMQGDLTPLPLALRKDDMREFIL